MEAMEEPNLGQMDAHWQQMAGMLQPAVLPVKKGWPKWMLNGLSGVAVVVLIGVALMYLSSKKNNEVEATAKQKETIIKENADVNAATAVQPPASSDSAAPNATTAFNQPIIKASLINNGTFNEDAKRWAEEDSLLGTVKLNVAPCGNCDDKAIAVTLTGAERQLKLQTLFIQLGKKEQRFFIDNSRDTLLQFEEGTVLLVPANSFGGMNGVEISAKEFYKTSDIILNQLNTISNKEQLETGGMLYITASYKGKEAKISYEKSLRLFMPDTTQAMKGMGLFNGEMVSAKEEKTTAGFGTGKNMEAGNSTGLAGSAYSENQLSLNWVPQGQYFLNQELVMQVKVLNIVDEPYKIRETKKGEIGYFLYSDEIDIDKKKIKEMLKEKYGYYKVKFRPSFRDIHFLETETDKNFRYEYARNIGDSVWMDKTVADEYKIAGTATRQIMKNQWVNNRLFGGFRIDIADTLGRRAKKRAIAEAAAIISNNDGVYNLSSEKILKEINKKYSVNISKLGWINCDRFYADSRKKIVYKVNLGDEASNYYTMLVFDNIKSMMTGYINGNEVAFQNIPVGEPVKIISIGINQKGETVYSVTHTTTSEEVLKGLQFQTTSAPDLKASLSKIDN